MFWQKRKKLVYTVLALLGLGAFNTLSNIAPSSEINLFMQDYFSLIEGFVLLLAVQAGIGLIYLSYRRWGRSDSCSRDKI